MGESNEYLEELPSFLEFLPRQAGNRCTSEKDQDQDNYYFARANPLENNYGVYKVVNGNRMHMSSYNLKVISEIWHNIKIVNQGNKIQCYYNGVLYLEVYDNTFKRGKIGLWTKADAVTTFDNIRVKEILP